MPTTQDIHNEVEPWLAAAVHGQLSREENAAFREHLATCAACRSLYEQEQATSTMIENTLQTARPDLAFEQRIVSSFRRKAPARGSFLSPLAHLLRMRATQMTAVAALLLALVQMGRVVTGKLGGPEGQPAAAMDVAVAPRPQSAASGGAVGSRANRESPGVSRRAMSPQDQQSYGDAAQSEALAPMAAPPGPTTAAPAPRRHPQQDHRPPSQRAPEPRLTKCGCSRRRQILPNSSRRREARTALSRRANHLPRKLRRAFQTTAS
jgi:hypothetical protein